MKVVAQSRYGGPEVLRIEERPKPVPGAGEILVRVHACTVTLADCAFRKADPFIVRLFGGLFRPRSDVLGDDIAGVIEAVGPGVSRFGVGQAVHGSVGTQLGGMAEGTSIFLWLIGNLASARAELLAPLAVLVAIGLLCALPQTRALNLLALGEESAEQLGVPVERAKRLLLLATALMVGAAVSVSGLIGGHNTAAYNASKGGVRLLTKSVALHGARLEPKVRCNSVHPAFLEGPMVNGIAEETGHPDGARARMTRDIPMGRMGKPTEVADLCVYLLSDESAFVTGAEFAIDGGLTAK